MMRQKLPFLILLAAGFMLVSCRESPLVAPTVAPMAVTVLPPTRLVQEEATSRAEALFLPAITSVERPTATATVTPAPTVQPTMTPTPDFPLYTGPPLDREEIGIQLHLHREDISEIATHLRRLGVGWVKVQVSWKLYQPYPDQYASDRFEELDKLVNMASANDLSILLSVSKAPEWSRPTTELDGPPLDYTLFREFMSYLAGRYPGRIAAYELWNEPNLAREWNGTPLSAAQFVSLMREGAFGVRSADPVALLISGAPATTGINDGVAAIDDRVFFQEMLAAGAAELVDAYGVHPYGWSNPPDSRVGQPDPAVPSHNDHPSFFFLDTLYDYLALMEARGVSQQLWVTEFGWGSFDGFEASPPAGAEFMNAVSEWQQAVYTLRAYELAHEREWIGPMMLWNLNFAPLLGRQFPESGYSALGPDGQRRPVYRALASIPKN